VGTTASVPEQAVQADGPSPRPGSGHGSRRRSRPLSRDYGGDPRSGELVESMQRHQRAISEHEGALLHDVAQFDRTEAWRGDGVPCASATFHERAVPR
jgi:hypothetical protein